MKVLVGTFNTKEAQVGASLLSEHCETSRSPVDGSSDKVAFLCHRWGGCCLLRPGVNTNAKLLSAAVTLEK